MANINNDEIRIEIAHLRVLRLLLGMTLTGCKMKKWKAVCKHTEMCTSLS
jgi:hypothetical protein